MFLSLTIQTHPVNIKRWPLEDGREFSGLEASRLWEMCSLSHRSTSEIFLPHNKLTGEGASDGHYNINIFLSTETLS